MSKKCMNCGAELDDVAVFCDECGTQQVAATTEIPSPTIAERPTPVKQTEPGMKNSGFGIASLVLGILAICTFGILIIPEIISLVLGIVDMTNKNTKHGVSIVGVILSVIATVLIILLSIMG